MRRLKIILIIALIGFCSGGGLLAETFSQQNAVSKAKSYLRYSAFSKSGLIDQLEYEGFSNFDALYGTDHSGANWKVQAVEKAKSYLKYSSFSRSGLIEQLKYEGFTNEQAIYGVDNSGFGSNSSSTSGSNSSSNFFSQKNAVSKAKSYLRYSAFSRSGLIDQLEYEGFSHSDAVYGANHCEVNWKEQAVEKAKSYLEYSSFSRSGLIDQLKFEGFTNEQAIYGVDNSGY